MEIGLGRKNRYNDEKGLPDGVAENNPIFISFSFGLYQLNEVSSKKYQAMNEQYSNSLISIPLNQTYKFSRYQYSFGKLNNYHNELIYVRYDTLSGKYKMKFMTKSYQDEKEQEIFTSNNVKLSEASKGIKIRRYENKD